MVCDARAGAAVVIDFLRGTPVAPSPHAREILVKRLLEHQHELDRAVREGTCDDVMHVALPVHSAASLSRLLEELRSSIWWAPR